VADEAILSDPKHADIDVMNRGLLAAFQVSPKLCRWLASGALVAAFLISLICLVVWVSLLVGAANKSVGTPPEWTGDKNDFSKQNAYMTAEYYHHRILTEQRTTASQGCMQLAGVGLIFLALGLFLIALGRARSSTVSFKEWEITAAGIAALVCATLMFIYSMPQSGSGRSDGNIPYGFPAAAPPSFQAA
jgi:hypothetical protein